MTAVQMATHSTDQTDPDIREVDATQAVERLREMLLLAAGGDLSSAVEAQAMFAALDTYLQGPSPLPAQWRSAVAWDRDSDHSEGHDDEQVIEDGDWLLFGSEATPQWAVQVVAPQVPPQAPRVMLPAPAPHLVPTAPLSSTHAPAAGTPLSQVQDWTRERLYDGVRCVACDQFAKVYRRNIYATLAKHMITMLQMGGAERRFLSLSKDLKQGGGDMGKMRYWGLVEEEKTVFAENGRQGYWRLTETGAAFVRGEVTLPKYAYVYDGVCLNLGGKQVSIREALGKKFDYDDLMAN